MARIQIKDEATGVTLEEGDNSKYMMKRLRLLQSSYTYLQYVVNGVTKYSIGKNF